MTTGANFEVENERVLWYRPLISGEQLLIQDHEARVHAKQGTYLPYSEYGNPFVATLSSEINKTERDMRLVSETKECSLQDPRFTDCIVDTETISEEDLGLTFKYELIRADGGIIAFPSAPSIIRGEEPELEILYYNRITEERFNRISEDGSNRITEFTS